MSESESVQDLINRMVEEGEYPPPELLEAILERGQEAIEPLLEVLKNGPHEDAIGFAAELLLSLRALEALPTLLELFR